MSRLPINIPPRVTPGKPITALWANQIREAIDRLARRKTESPVAGGGGSSQPLKLTIKKGTAVDKFQIIPGTVNGEMPTLATVALDDATAPEATIAATTYFWLKCVGTFGTPDTYVVTVETATTAGVPAGTDITATGFTSFYYIGMVEVDTAPDPDTYTTTNQHGGGNLGVDSWGLYNLWWRS